MGDAFKVQILEQGWLDGCCPEHDLSSHGRISLVIGGTRIADEGGDFGISESALAMLRTLESNHSQDAPVAEKMVLHGCGLILMMGCPIGIDWSVTHCKGDNVRISDVVWYAETNEEAAVRYPGLAVELPLLDYRAQISAFARKAEGLFHGVEKRPDDDFDKQQHQEFWEEYHELVGRNAL